MMKKKKWKKLCGEKMAENFEILLKDIVIDPRVIMNPKQDKYK